MSSFPLKRGWHSCALVAGISSLLVLPGLGALGFWDPSELDVLERALAGQPDPSSPLVQWTTQEAVQLGGLGGCIARLPVALFGVVTALLCLLWLARASSLRVATTASLMLVCSPLYLLHARQLVSLMPCVAAHLVVILGVAAGLHGRRPALGVVVALLGLCIGYAAAGAVLGIALPTIALGIACAACRQWRASALLTVVAAIALACAWSEHLAVAGPWHPMPAHISWSVTLEQVAFGAFPWIAWAPAALLSLRIGPGRQGFARAVALCWVGTCLALVSAHSFHIGPTMFFALPALAFAVSQWIWDLPRARPRSHQVLLLAMLMIMLGLDLQNFSERLPALHLPVESLADARASTWQGRVFVITAALLSATLMTTFSRRLRRHVPFVAIGTCLVFATWLSHGWLPTVSKQLSHSHLVKRYLVLRGAGEPVYSLGGVPRVLRLYAPSARAQERAQLVQAMAGGLRVFALVPRSALCSFRQAARREGSEPFVLEQTARFALISNQHKASEPRDRLLEAALGRRAPSAAADLGQTVFADTIRLHSVELPSRVQRGSEFRVRLRYEVLKRPQRKWKVFAHFDGPGIRFQGDHWPIEDRCASNHWNPGDFVDDVFTVRAGGMAHPKGDYRVWTGFFYGANGNWTNMPVTAGAHEGDRVLLGQIEVY